MREDNGNEARIKEAHIETKEKLEGGEVMEGAYRSTTVVGHGGIAHKRKCAIMLMNDL